jgi:hypothetical protein
MFCILCDIPFHAAFQIFNSDLQKDETAREILLKMAIFTPGPISKRIGIYDYKKIL